MPNVMAAQPNTGGALSESSVIPFLVPRHKVWLTAAAQVLCSNAAKTRNPLKSAGVPQTPKPISAVSGPKFAILCRHVEEILLFGKFFFLIVNTCLSCEDSTQQSCTMVRKWQFLHPVLHFQRAACSTFQTYILNSH